MRAKFIKDTEEMNENFDELVVSIDQTTEELINLVHSADRMLQTGIEPLLHTKDEYKKARRKAIKILSKYHKLSRNEIQTRLSEAILLKESFDVLTWSRKKLSKEIADQIEETHEGGYGEKLQNSLLKIINKDELMKWVNKNFEIGEIFEMEGADQNPWNQVFSRVRNSINSEVITSEEQLEVLISFLIKHGEYNLSNDDIEDAAWAAYEETK